MKTRSKAAVTSKATAENQCQGQSQWSLLMKTSSTVQSLRRRNQLQERATKAAVKAEPEDDEQDDAAEAKTVLKKGKAKATAPKADSAELEDENDEQDDATEAKPAPKKGKAKATAPKADSAELTMPS
jgi:hypothetical protein